MDFLLNARLGESSLGKVLKTLLFVLLYQGVSGLLLGILLIINNLRTKEEITLFFSNERSALGALVFFSGFVLSLLGLIRQIRKQHKRNWRTLITIHERVNVKKIIFALVIWGAFHCIKIAIYVAINPSAYSFTTNYFSFAIFAFVIFLLVPFQSAFEEMLFRGYLLQESAVVIRRVWVLTGGTTIVFALMHIFNPEVKQYGIIAIMPFYVALGITCCTMTIMDNSNELAIGFHTANNLCALLILGTYTTTVPPLRILIVEKQDPIWWFEYLYLVVASIGFLLILSRKYHWASWSILWGTLPMAVSATEQTNISENPSNNNY